MLNNYFTGVVKSGPVTPEPESMTRQSSILQDFPLRWVFWWVVLPNLALMAMWLVGGPKMGAQILLAGIAALLICCSTNLVLRTIGMVAIYAFLLLTLMSRIFYLTIEKSLNSLAYVTEMNLLSSPLYAAMALVLGACILLGAWFGPRTARPRGLPQIALALGSVALLVQADTMLNKADRGSYMARAPQGTPVSSAAIEVDLAPELQQSRNVLIVILESVGVPNNAHDRAIYDSIWDRRKWDANYIVETGEVPFYGSTTSAEMRELCSAWADPARFRFEGSDCLPERFGKAGFETIAVHGFTGEFFNRKQWYPKAGFERSFFGGDLLQDGKPLCDGVFTGVCDRDIPHQISQMLGHQPDRRKLIYWLTLSGHLPVDDNATMGLAACDLGSSDWQADYPMLCRSYMIQRQIADALQREMDSPGFADTDILLVGDHIPPFFQSSIRERFKSGTVPYLYLRRRREPEDLPV
jgi:hypothetical protein